MQQRMRSSPGRLSLWATVAPHTVILTSRLAADTLQAGARPHLVDREARLLRQHLLLNVCSAASLAQHIHAHARRSQQPHRMAPQVGKWVSHAWCKVRHSVLSDDGERCAAWPASMRGY